MSKKEELIKTYINDLEAASSKQKFGFFSIPPSPFAGSISFENKTIIKDENGKVKTQQRNIFSGQTATGILKKSYFSYPEYKTGEIYMDPGKVDRQRQMKENEKFKEKQTFRPASINKTLCNASYEYLPQKETRQDPKLLRRQDGKVRVQNPNILCSPASKLAYRSQRKLKYIGEPYQNAHLLKRKQLFDSISKRGQTAFKPSSPIREYFLSNKQQFHEVKVPVRKSKETQYNIQQHDSNFRPAGNHFNDGIFSYPKYQTKQDKKNENKFLRTQRDDVQKKEPFRLIKQEKNSKPCPSISVSRMNLMRCLR